MLGEETDKSASRCKHRFPQVHQSPFDVCLVRRFNPDQNAERSPTLTPEISSSSVST